MEIKRTTNVLVFLFLILKLLWIFEAKSCPEHITNVYSRPQPLIPPHFSTQNQDMCHATIGSSLIEIVP